MCGGGGGTVRLREVMSRRAFGGEDGDESVLY